MGRLTVKMKGSWKSNYWVLEKRALKGAIPRSSREVSQRPETGVLNWEGDRGVALSSTKPGSGWVSDLWPCGKSLGL